MAGSTKPRVRGAATRWKPGQSGNPAGRPKTPSEFREACREHTAAALAVLLAGLDGKSETLRQAAANSILDRGWGRAMSSVDIAMHDIPHAGGAERGAATTDEWRIRALEVFLRRRGHQPVAPVAAHVISDHEASELSPCYTGEKRQ